MEDFPFQLIFPVLFIAFGLVAFFAMRKFSRGQSEAGLQQAVPLMRVFFERTGYRFVDQASAPIEMQIARWQQVYAASIRGEGYDVHLVRDFHGLEVHWEQFTGQQGGAYVMAQSWWAPLPAMPRAPFHIAERSLASTTGKLAKEMLTNMSTNWKPAFERQIQTGDPHLDGRFVVYGPDEQAVRMVLSNPALRQALFECAYVDLRVTPDGVRFSDPEQKNTLAMMGGTYGAMQYAGNPGKAFEVTLPVHDRVANLLYGAATLAR
ncbi:MAG: hypothetical protein HYV09_11440 [Deltaproteobacteria bacterium]|nr:hypothetical protein [Deltaproteobacteria bacterium]